MEKKYEFKSDSNNPLSTIITVVFVILVLFLLFRLFAFVTRILTFLTPILLIATLIIDHKVVLNYVKMLVNMTKKSWPMGLGATILSIIGIPFVSVFLFSKAMLKRKVKKVVTKAKAEREGEFVTFEELDDEVVEETQPEILELEDPDLKKKNEYEELFDDAEIEDDNLENNTNLWD